MTRISRISIPPREFLRPDGPSTGGPTGAGSIMIGNFTPQKKTELLFRFFDLISRCLVNVPAKFGAFTWEIQEKLGQPAPSQQKGRLDAEIKIELESAATNQPKLNLDLLPVYSRLLKISPEDRDGLARELGHLTFEQLRELVLFPEAHDNVINSVVSRFHDLNAIPRLLKSLGYEKLPQERNYLLSARLAAALLRLGDLASAEVPLQELEYLDQADLISWKPSAINLLRLAFSSIFDSLVKNIPDILGQKGLALLTDRYSLEGSPLFRDPIIVAAGYLYPSHTIDNLLEQGKGAGSQMDERTHPLPNLLKLGKTLRAMSESPSNSFRIFAQFWNQLQTRGDRVRVGVVEELRRMVVHTDLLPKNLLSALSHDMYLQIEANDPAVWEEPVARPDKTILPVSDQARTIRDAVLQIQFKVEIGITGLPIDREHYDEIRDVDILKHGDIIPGHNFILGKPDSYKNGRRELLTINIQSTSNLFPIMERAAQLAAAHRGNLVDLAYEIADMVHRKYARGQGKEEGGVQLTLGGPIITGGCCRHRSATLQMAYQAAGIPSRYVRGFFMLQEEGWHAWVEVAPESPFAFIVDLNMDPRDLGTGQKLEEFNRGKIIPSKYKMQKYPNNAAYEVNGLHYTRESNGAVVWRPKY